MCTLKWFASLCDESFEDVVMSPLGVMTSPLGVVTSPLGVLASYGSTVTG